MCTRQKEGHVSQVEDAASAKAQRWERAQHSQGTGPEWAFPRKRTVSLDYAGVTVSVTEPKLLSPPRVPALSSCRTDTPRMGLPQR